MSALKNFYQLKFSVDSLKGPESNLLGENMKRAEQPVIGEITKQTRPSLSRAVNLVSP